MYFYTVCAVFPEWKGPNEWIQFSIQWIRKAWKYINLLAATTRVRLSVAIVRKKCKAIMTTRVYRFDEFECVSMRTLNCTEHCVSQLPASLSNLSKQSQISSLIKFAQSRHATCYTNMTPGATCLIYSVIVIYLRLSLYMQLPVV